MVKMAQRACDSKGDGFPRGDFRSMGSGNVFIRVSPGLVDRALRVMNAFIKAMRQRGHDLYVKESFTRSLFPGRQLEWL